MKHVKEYTRIILALLAGFFISGPIMLYYWKDQMVDIENELLIYKIQGKDPKKARLWKRFWLILGLLFLFSVNVFAFYVLIKIIIIQL